jgi:heat shock protein HtpX
VAKTRFAPDRGLTSRMVLVMFLIGLLAVAFIAALVAFVPAQSLPIVLVLAGVLLFAQFFFSDKIATFAMGAREVQPNDSPEAAALHAMVDRLCSLADMPKPRVAIAQTSVPNAFATGRNPKNAVICVTTGLLRNNARLTQEEVEGVLAHELSHVAHRDVMVITIASFLGILAGLVGRMAFWFGLGGDRRDDRDGGVPVQLIIMLVSVVTYAISFLLIRALSRYREFAADRAGALLTGQPMALASALGKITGDMAKIPQQDLRAAEPFNAFYFAPAFSKESMMSLLSTHPSTDKRIEQLYKINAQLGGPAPEIHGHRH